VILYAAAAYVGIVLGALAALHHLRDEVDERPLRVAELEEHEPDGQAHQYAYEAPGTEVHIKVARQ
jgi:hypothetical protein